MSPLNSDRRVISDHSTIRIYRRIKIIRRSESRFPLIRSTSRSLDDQNQDHSTIRFPLIQITRRSESPINYSKEVHWWVGKVPTTVRTEFRAVKHWDCKCSYQDKQVGGETSRKSFRSLFEAEPQWHLEVLQRLLASPFAMHTWTKIGRHTGQVDGRNTPWNSQTHLLL